MRVRESAKSPSAGQHRPAAPVPRSRWLTTAGLAGALTAAPAWAAVDFAAMFSLKGQSVYGPGAAVDWDVNQRLGPPPFEFGKTYDETFEVCFIKCLVSGVRAGADTNGSFGLNYGAKVNSGSYDLLYPVFAHIAEPAPLSNRVATPFTLGTSFTVPGYTAPAYQEYLNGQRVVAKLTTHSPTLQAYVDLDARFHAFVGAQACVLSACTGPALGPVNGDASQPLAAINRNNDGRVRLLNQVIEPRTYFSMLDGNVTARLNIPNIDAVSKPDSSTATQLNTLGRDSIASLGVNVGNLVSKAVGLPLVGNAGGIGYNLLSVNAGLGLDLAQTLSVKVTPVETFNFLSPVQRQLADGSWSGTTKQITVPLGESLVLKSAFRTVGVVPSTSLQLSFSNLTELVIQGDFNVQALAANIYGINIGPLYDSGPGHVGKFNIPLYNESFSFATGAISGLPFNVVQALPDSVSADPGYRALFSLGQPDDHGLQVGEIRAVQAGDCKFCPVTVYGSTDPSTINQFGDRVFMVDADSLTLAANQPGELGTDESQLALLFGTGFSDVRVPLVSPIGLSNPVPEPAPGTLLALGLAVAAATAWRRRTRGIA